MNNDNAETGAVALADLPTTAVPAPAAVLAPPTTTLVAKLQGGIGNQLFQIAYAEQVAQANGMALTFNTEAYASDGYGRTCILHRLLPEATLVAISSLPAATTRVLREQLGQWPGGADGNGAGGLPLNFQVPNEVSHLLLDGFWQDHRVADPVRVAALQARIAAGMGTAVRALAERISRSSRPTALHLRRRDYAHHGLCSMAYYAAALRWLTARSGELNVYVFTDEPNSTSVLLQQAGIQAQRVVTGDDLADLWLMSQCSRHVISNSTFSWWGAMLSDGSEVIAPAPWSRMHSASPQLLPKHWKTAREALETPAPIPPVERVLDEAQFQIDRDAFFAQDTLPEGWQIQLRPCYGDATANTGFDAHYVYHTAWAARRLLANPVAEHVDISSDIRFVTLVSAFQTLRFLDYRPAQLRLSNLTCGAADLLALQLPDDSVASLSCMHVVEHIGLGRYGDPVNFHGAEMAMQSLQRVLAPGGLLYFVVPVGRPTVVFNAHRIFRASDIVLQFCGLELLEFSVLDDAGQFFENQPLSASDGLSYGSGCFLFRKPG